MKLYQRKLLQPLKKAAKAKEIVVLTGMRQTGKSTLYRMIFDEIKSDNKVFLDLENPLEQKIFEEKDYNNIILNLKEYGINPRSKMYVFLDEIQEAPEAIKAIKYLYDHYKIKFFLTGSSSFYLKNLFPESLAGRKFAFELFPLDFEEFLVFKDNPKDFEANFSRKAKNKNEIRHEKLKKYYEEYMRHGGFPEVVLKMGVEAKKMKLNDIFKSYFEKDVKILADFRNIRAFRDLIILLMRRVGSKVEISKLASEVGVSRETVYSFLSFLESTYFISLVSPFAKNVDREVSGRKKVYLCDNGFLSHFARVSEGSLFENSVFLNLRKYGKINYYQKRKGGEIDFIVDGKTAIEVKLGGVDGDFRKLKRTAESVGIKDCYLATGKFGKGKFFIPALEL